MKILVINTGSSSIKYQLIDMEGKEVLSKGLLERIGLPNPVLNHKLNDGKIHVIQAHIKDHEEGMKLILDTLLDEKLGAIKSLSDIDAVGHRVVHAGEKYASSVRITSDVINALEECSELAPLHNPPNLMGISAAQKLLPDVPHVAVFDTAFHQAMPPKAYLYAIPMSFYDKYGIRRYGFHGTSHRYVARRAGEMLGKNWRVLKIVTCHLGNGASMAAIDKGKSVDTSMGFTPLEGLYMGTRCGNIDPAIVIFLEEKENLTPQQVYDLLNKKSGMLGASGVSSDMRDIEDHSANGDKRARTSLEMYAYQIKRYIGSYVAAMNGIDVLVFTAGIGENSPLIRKMVCENMDYLGIEIDESKNEVRGKERIISSDNSKVEVMVIPTNEELVIAEDTEKIVKEGIEELPIV
ncbi:MAG: acetate kinase [Thermotoga sp.]|nr:acetate kinase [Thermotogota bacterium]RKX53635.1 MAG: acetate kinase [Thermotoga sp.]